MKRILPVIVIAQFFCTSVWFAGNAMLPDLISHFHLAPDFLAHITSAVQFGFISGTFLFALLTISDRFSPSRVFFCSAIIAGLFNLGITIGSMNATGLLCFRFFTGFFLAGIYPVGMKIASDYYQKGLGLSLGFLVGALVVGTALPHLLKSISLELPWRYVLYATSTLCAAGGLAILFFVPDGPYRRAGQKPDFRSFVQNFGNKKFRSAAFGYFGHMWELYTFWAFLPVMLATYQSRYPEIQFNIALLSFFIIASGGLACVAGGFLSQRYGAKKIAALALSLSCMCCLFSPLFLFISSPQVFIIFLFFWGIVVVGDSPLFSTLVAQNAAETSRGTSLTIVNCIGFSITIVSTQFINLVSGNISPQYMYMLLAIGPLLGLMALGADKR